MNVVTPHYPRRKLESLNAKPNHTAHLTGPFFQSEYQKKKAVWAD